MVGRRPYTARCPIPIEFGVFGPKDEGAYYYNYFSTANRNLADDSSNDDVC